MTERRLLKNHSNYEELTPFTILHRQENRDRKMTRARARWYFRPFCVIGPFSPNSTVLSVALERLVLKMNATGLDAPKSNVKDKIHAKPFFST